MAKTSTEQKKQMYLECLLTSSSQKEAYQKAHIAKATAMRYQKDPDFQKQYKEMRRRSMEFTGNRLRELTSKAVDTLSDVMDDPEATPTEQTRAAKIVLDSAFQVANQQDILDRLDKLESEAAEQDES
ncbi:hypothetical protein E0712_04595 [Lactobacillus helveticus]|uniref:hypothetical protein n=1 Tax=Lactobacillus helveticus TaxID=1587 RepID=UPI001C64B549|nr:hypothetical protein [Lactobacillus helveticus]MBW8013750.1 hypothetical protein [Lactobacillus helveticus]